MRCPEAYFRQSFSMPDIHSIGLGGGSRVRFSSGETLIGPDSVGHELTSRAIVFGGDTLTATDLAISATQENSSASDGRYSGLGDPAHLSGLLSPEQVSRGMAYIGKMLETAIDRMKTDPGDIRVLLVGGGAILVPKSLKGVSEIVRPPFHDVANAVGAAIARVAGEVDCVEIPGGPNGDIEDIVERCKSEAVNRAIRNGATEHSVEIVEVAIIQLPVRFYLTQ